jgi:hypothetical protein
MAFSTYVFNFCIQLARIADMIVSDQISIFMDIFWPSLIATLKVKVRILVGYYTDTDEQYQKVNYIIRIYLRILMYYVSDL